MPTSYTHRVTIVCPADLIPDANQLALVLGESPSDDHTFGAPHYEDAGGNLYAVSSTVATGNFQTKAGSPLQAPGHAPDADLVAAARAQAAIYIHGQHGPDGAAPGRLWVSLEPAPGNARAALDVAGVTPVPQEAI